MVLVYYRDHRDHDYLRDLSDVSVVPQARTQQDSFFSLMVPFASGVHHLLWELPPWQTPATLQPQLLAVASAIEVWNILYSHSLRFLPKFCRKWEMKISQTRNSVPGDSQFHCNP